MSHCEETLEVCAALSTAEEKGKEHETVALARDAGGNMLPGDPIRDSGIIDSVPGCQLLSVLGSGGMGTVYLALQENLNRLVAVKVLNPRFADNPRFLRFINQEALTMGALSHPNIVSCHDFITTEKGIFIIMEYIPGRLTGRDLVLRLGPLPEDMVVDILLQAVRALAYVHSKGYTHRDLKPDNLLIYRDSQFPPRNFADVFNEPDNRVMVCDFGIAAGIQMSVNNSDGVLFGCPAFMAPEQAFAPEKTDFRADIYALASTAVFFLTGKAPFDGHERDERLLLKAENDIPDPVLEKGKKPRREFLAVLRKMGALEPEARYQDYRQLVSDLEYLSLFYADRAKRLPYKLMRRKRSFFFGLSFGVLGICVAFAVLYFQRYLSVLEEVNYVSKTISMIFWEGEREGWRIFQRDAGSSVPSLTGFSGAESLRLRENLSAGQGVKFNLRLQGQQSTSISLLDDQNKSLASFSFYGFRNSNQLVIRMNVEEDNIPMGAADLATELEWTNIKISVMPRQIWFYVNGELRGFRHQENEIGEWRLQIDKVNSSYIQLKDLLIFKLDNGV